MVRITWLWAGCMALLGSGFPARAELAAHWKFEAEAPFEDSVSRRLLNAESSAPGDKRIFKSEASVAARAVESAGSLTSPDAQGIDLRLRVNAPTQGANPFRLSGNSWTLSGWLSHSGARIEDRFGQAIAGTHGFLPGEGKGFAGWCLRVQEIRANTKVLSAIFSTGGSSPSEFELIAGRPLETEADKWVHFALVWKHDGGRSGRGEATLFVDAKKTGVAQAPRDFDAETADLNAFRGIWIAGRPTSEKGVGRNNWAGRLDEIKFMTDTVADEKLLVAEFLPEEPKEAPKPIPAPIPEPAPEPAPAPAKELAMKEEPPAKADAAPEVAPVEPVEPEAPVEDVLELRAWKDLRGLSVQAGLVLDPVQKKLGRITLLTEDKIRFTMPLERLSAADQEYVKSKGG